MPLFNATATLFTVERGAVDKSILAFQTREMAGAMRAFLRACLPRIPARTGFLRAAFRPLRQQFPTEVNDPPRASSNAVRNNGRKRARGIEYYYYGVRQRVAKTQENALQFITPQDPSKVIQIRGAISEIKFDVDISYYRINDFTARITGAPWRSLEAGFEASLNYLESAVERYPILSEIITTQRIYLRGNRVGVESNATNQAASYRGRFSNPT